MNGNFGEQQLELELSNGKAPKPLEPESGAEDKKAELIKVLKKSPRLFNRKAIFGDDYKETPAQGLAEPSQGESMGRPESRPRPKFRAPYPQGYDGNPIITKDSERQKG